MLPIHSAMSSAVAKVLSPAVIGGVGKSKLSVVPSSDILKVQPAYILLHPSTPMVVTAGIAAAVVRDVQPAYILSHPPSPMVVTAGIAAAEVRDVQP